MIATLTIAVLAFSICLFFPSIHGSRVKFHACAVSLLAHQVISILQVTIGPLPFVDSDPVDFQNYANGISDAESRLVKLPYLVFLRWAYSAMDGSNLLGCEFSFLAFALTLIVLVTVMNDLKIQETKQAWLILLYSWLPSFALNTSVVLRESWQAFAFLLFSYSLLAIRNEKYLKGSGLLSLSILLMANLHNGLPAYVAAICPLALLWAFSNKRAVQVAILIVGISFLGVFGKRVISSLKARSAALTSITSGEGLDYVNTYTKRVGDARSAFPVQISLGSPGAAVKTVPVVFAYYLFSPFPWDVKGPKDAYAFFESCLRIILFALAIYSIIKCRPEERSKLLLLFFLLLSIELMWSAGTANTGTAVRHRVVGWAVLVTLGGIGWTKLDIQKFGPKKPMSIRERRRASQKRSRRLHNLEKNSTSSERGLRNKKVSRVVAQKRRNIE